MLGPLVAFVFLLGFNVAHPGRLGRLVHVLTCLALTILVQWDGTVDWAALPYFAIVFALGYTADMYNLPIAELLGEELQPF